MGAWGIGHFENDEAMDFILIVEKEGTLAVMRALKEMVATPVVRPQESLKNKAIRTIIESSSATKALAAAAIVSAVMGRSRWKIRNSSVLSVIKKHQLSLQRKKSLVPIARAAVKRILRTESALSQLWEETKDYKIWKQNVEALLRSL